MSLKVQSNIPAFKLTVDSDGAEVVNFKILNERLRADQLMDVGLYPNVTVNNNPTTPAEDVEWADILNRPSEFPPTAHTHTEGEISNLDKYTQAQVDAFVTALTNAIALKADLAHTHTESDISDLDKYTQAYIDNLETVFNNAITNLQSQLGDYVPLSSKGQAGGVPDLDSGAKIPISQIPDEAKMAVFVSSLPGTGLSETLYVLTSTLGIYYYSGLWVELSPGFADAPADGNQYARQDNAWVINAGGGGGGLENSYADIASMLADQGNQNENGIQVVLDASADTTIESGYAYYQKLAASTSDISDYRLISKQEALSSGTEPKYIQLSLGAVQNVGGVNGTQHRFNWTVQDHIDTDVFTHDTVTDNDQITILEDGWYYIHHNFLAAQTGANRTVQFGRLWINGVIDSKFIPVTYGRGATFGVQIGYQATYRVYFEAGDVVEIGVQVSDPDNTYVTNANALATTVMIHQEPGTRPGPQGPVGPTGAAGGAPDTIADAGTSIDLDNVYGNRYNKATPNTNTTFTVATTIEGGWATVRIDTTGVLVFPTVTGAERISGHVFQADWLYDMFLEVVDGNVEYSFIAVKSA